MKNPIPAGAVRLLSVVALAAGQSACILVINDDNNDCYYDGCYYDDGYYEGEDADGDGILYWADCDDADASVGDECFDEGVTVDDDADGIPNDEEQLRGTDPWNPDTDGDGWSDLDERDCGSSPLDAWLGCEAAEGEGEGEGEEIVVADDDRDDDGRTNDEEAGRGTDPDNADTDGDGFSDGEENACNSSPLDAWQGCVPPQPPED